jgi:hypothetical protein
VLPARANNPALVSINGHNELDRPGQDRYLLAEVVGAILARVNKVRLAL